MIGPHDITQPAALSHWKESVATRSTKESQVTDLKAKHGKRAKAPESIHPLPAELDG